MRKSLYQIAFPVISALFIHAPAFAQSSQTAIDVLKDQGVEVVHEFDAPMNLKGYIGDTGAEHITFYSTGDDKHLIFGTMINDKGENISERMVHSKVIAPKLEAAWERIENSYWVQDGYAGEQPVLYTFTDPNCPYCALFREQMNPWVESNDIQLRHIMVGIIAEDSMEKSAVILKSVNPGELLLRQQKTLREGGIIVDETLVSEGYADVKENNRLMDDLGFGGTPITVYKDSNGNIQIIQGVLGQAQIDTLIKEGF